MIVKRKGFVAASATLVVVGLSLVACVPTGPQSGDGSGTQVVLRTDYKFNGYVAPFALALERGYYDDAGLDLSIEQGQGSATTVQTVASGRDHVGLADATTTVRAIANQGVPVKNIAVYLQTVPTGS